MNPPYTKQEALKLAWIDFPMESMAPPYRVIKRKSRYRGYVAAPGMETWDRVDRVSYLTMEEAKRACEEHNIRMDAAICALEIP